MNLFMSEPVRLPDAHIAPAQALADVATTAIVQNEATRVAVVHESRLQHAFESKIVIEHATG